MVDVLMVCLLPVYNTKIKTIIMVNYCNNFACRHYGRRRQTYKHRAAAAAAAACPADVTGDVRLPRTMPLPVRGRRRWHGGELSLPAPTAHPYERLPRQHCQDRLPQQRRDIGVGGAPLSAPTERAHAAARLRLADVTRP